MIVKRESTQQLLVTVLALVQHSMPTRAVKAFVYSDSWVAADWMRGQ